MSETSRQWDSRAVEGRFPLQSYLGGSDHSAVYLTVTQVGGHDSEKAAIKSIPVEAADVEKQLQRWKAIRELSHPNLIRIFESGRDGTSHLYVVEEYAEENLSQILPDRALTAEETRGMLPSILRALQYVHDQGFIHSHIQPSNILAIGDQVKLASDTLVAAGDTSHGTGPTSAYDPPEALMGGASTAGDVWRLGMTLVEALTQRLPAWDRARPSAPEVPTTVPEPFREIAAHCLQIDAGKRWTVGEIIACLESDRLGATNVAPSSGQAEKPASGLTSMRQPDVGRQNLGHENLGSHKASAKWPYLLVLAAVVAIAFLLLGKPRPSSHPTEIQPTQARQGAATEGSDSVQSPTQPELKSSPAMPGKSKTDAAKVKATTEAGGTKKRSPNADTTNLSAANEDDQSDVVQRVMPQVSPTARGTIEGKVRVRVKVEVDAAGNVAKAELESAGPSKYFSRLALEAARGWKFSPARTGEPGDREWMLHFAFGRLKTDVSVARTKR
jgi:TonB family protein